MSLLSRLLGRQHAPQRARNPWHGEAKASAVGRLIAQLTLGQPVWPKRDYEQLAREGYQQNPVVYRAVQLVAQGVASVSYELHKGRGDKQQTIEDHPLLELLRHPNPVQDGHALIESLISHLMISGNGYLERTDERELDRMEVYALRPDRVRVVPGTDGWAEAYEYTVGGLKRRWEVDPYRGRMPILHMRRFHPTDDFYGMSPLDPGAWSVDVHSQAAAYNKALLENSGTPSGAFVYTGNPDNGNAMPDDMFERLKQTIDEQVSGAKNGGKPLVLEGGLDWKTMGIDLDKLQFVEAKNMAAREIAFSLGVPPMLLGIPGDNTYSNYVEANRAFYRSTVIPMAQWYARAVTQWFRPLLDGDLHLVVDLDTIDALTVEREAAWTKLQQNQFLTINEKRQALGYPSMPGGDEIFIAAGQIPLEQADQGTVRGGPAPQPGDQRNRLN